LGPTTVQFSGSTGASGLVNVPAVRLPDPSMYQTTGLPLVVPGAVEPPQDEVDP
jgi:hypothetical protein